MKKRYLLLGVLLMGCSASGEGSEESADAADSEELGQVDEGVILQEVDDIGEPIESGDGGEKTTMQDGYGSLRYSTASQIVPQLPTNDRCYLPVWFGVQHTCIVPSNRSITLKTVSSDQGDIHWTAAYNAAVAQFSSVLNARGWTVKQSSSGTDTVNLGTPSSPNALGETALTFNTGNCHNFAGAGKICYSGPCKTVISATALRNNAGWSTKTQTQKDRLLINVMLHELGHCAGLGHFPSPSAGENHVMNSTALNDFYNNIRGYTGNDMNMFQIFRP
jgi:predicted Zn-dependent protease